MCYRCKTETVPTAPLMSKTTYALYVWVEMDDQAALEFCEAYQKLHGLAQSSTRTTNDHRGGKDDSTVLLMEVELLCGTTMCYRRCCLSKRKGREQGQEA